MDPRPNLAPAPAPASVTAQAQAPATALVMAKEPVLLTDLAQATAAEPVTGRPADTGVMVADLALMSTVSATGTGRETTTAQPPHTGPVTATDQKLAAMALAPATHRVVRAAERTAQVMVTDTAQARGPIASTAKASTAKASTAKADIPATSVARSAVITDRSIMGREITRRAMAMTRATGTGLVIRVAATGTARPRVTDTGRRDRRDLTEADTRRTANTSAVATGSAMITGHLTTTGGTRSTQGQLVTRRIQPMADIARAGRLRPTATATSARTGRTPALMDRTDLSIRPVAGIQGGLIMAGHRKDSPATAMARVGQGSMAR